MRFTRAANTKMHRNISKRSYIEGRAYIDISFGFDICFASVFVKFAFGE